MARTQALDWKAWRNKEVKIKDSEKELRQQSLNKQIALAATGAIVYIVLSNAATALADPSSITAIADVSSFQDQLGKATKPIKDIIFGFAHEIYFVMMAWGGMEALIGRTQQGFMRMKASTAAYVLLFWVPWIVRQVNAVIPTSGW